ncbi:lipopolysaccharide biosynthesis protein [Novipirellula maiorica]|uniref:lipopolysaccharide biosynthesis protein n=1 Tax=Novipirellula maiorica TaxID=1265734 RepID=UPI001181C480|nr:lipopolysaccharide biosynthesis protein [Rhodopirellula maiorica]
MRLPALLRRNLSPASPDVIGDVRMPVSDRLRNVLQSPNLRGGSLSVLDQGIVSATNFLTTVMIGRWCGQDGLGIYFLAFNIVLLSRNIQYQLVAGPYTVFAHHRLPNQRASYDGSTLVHQSLLALFAAVMTWLSIRFLMPDSDLASGGILLVVLTLTLPFILFREFIRQVELAHLNLISVVSIDAVVAVVQLVGLVSLGWLGVISVGRAFALIGAGSLLAGIGWFVTRRPKFEFHVPEILADWRKNWSFGKWALASHLTGSSMPYLMPWITVVVRGEEETGLFAACTTLIGLSNVVVLGIDSFLTARCAASFASGGTQALKGILWRFMVIFLVLVGFFCLAVIAMGGPVVQWLYGAKYVGAGPIMVLLAFGVLARSMGIVAGAGIWAMHLPKANLISDVLTLVVAMAVTYFVVESHGVLGIAMATLAGSLVGAISRGTTVIYLLQRVTLTESDDAIALSVNQ